jgi:hypothetical protein
MPSTPKDTEMKTSITAATIFALIASPAFAQSTTKSQSGTQLQNQSGSASQNPSGAQGNTGSNNMGAVQKIKEDLQNAGFTDVKVMAESFVVQAKSKDGDPVLMTIGPHGMSVFEAMGGGSSGSNPHSTTGQGSGSNTGSSTASPDSNRK